MQRFTKVVTVLLPLTFHNGRFGRSFSYILEANWRHGFYAVLVLSRFSGF